jgi:D-glycero-D-manno-heptose 1,7-bisphosphate phosphatase
MNKAVFLDRDGVINQRPPQGDYVTRWEDMHVLPSTAEAVAMLNRTGFLVIVVSNQRCVAKGLISSGELESMHERMCRLLASQGATIDEVYYCPHEKQSGCACRKPAPGMLLTAANAHEIDLISSWMIGDSDIDIAAGRNAGCRTARLLTDDEPPKESAEITAESLREAVGQILALERVSHEKAPAETKNPSAPDLKANQTW